MGHFHTVTVPRIERPVPVPGASVFRYFASRRGIGSERIFWKMPTDGSIGFVRLTGENWVESHFGIKTMLDSEVREVSAIEAEIPPLPTAEASR